MTYKTSSDRTTAVSTEAHYMPMYSCPIAKKVILLGAGGVATVAQWDGARMKNLEVKTCKLMVKTAPKVGDVDRHPPPHQCTRPVYDEEGYCAQHSAKYQAIKQAQQIARNVRLDARDREMNQKQVTQSNGIDAAIVLLVNNGYRVEKLFNA